MNYAANKKDVLGKIIIYLVFILIFSFLLKNSFDYLDPDLGWHLKAGEEIFMAHQVPWNEHYDYTLEGKTWVDHEWLLNLFSFLIYSKLSYFTLNLIFALVGLGIFILINRYYIKKLIVDRLHLAFFLIFELIGLASILAHFGVRMQQFSVLLLLIQLILTERYETTKQNKWLFALPPLFMCWANLHGGFMLGLFVYWFYLAYILTFPTIAKYLKIKFLVCEAFDKSSLKKILLTAIISSLATLATPYHIKYFIFMFEYTNTYYMKIITEWLPIWHYPINYYQQAFLLIYISAIIILFINKRNNRVSGWHLFSSLLLFAASLKARRNFPLFFIASLPLLASASHSLNQANFTAMNFFIFNNRYLRIIVSLNLACAIILVISSANFTNAPFSNTRFCKFYPCAALAELKLLPQENLVIFNNYGWGGYLIWNLPEKKLFIDGRLPMLETNGHSLLEEYYDFFKKELIREKLERYGINLVLQKKTEQIRFNWFEKLFLGLKNDENQTNPIQEYLQSNKSWNLVFEDENAFMYYKK